MKTKKKNISRYYKKDIIIRILLQWGATFIFLLSSFFAAFPTVYLFFATKNISSFGDRQFRVTIALYTGLKLYYFNYTAIFLLVSGLIAIIFVIKSKSKCYVYVITTLVACIACLVNLPIIMIMLRFWL
jgi:hypothetical protein